MRIPIGACPGSQLHGYMHDGPQSCSRWLFLLSVVVGGADLSRGATADRVLMVRPGMTYQQVIEIFGGPVFIESELPPHIEDSVNVVHRLVRTIDPTGDHVVMTYPKPVRWAWTYPMLWITLKSGRVIDIYAKRATTHGEPSRRESMAFRRIGRSLGAGARRSGTCSTQRQPSNGEDPPEPGGVTLAAASAIVC
jgi:hypothetical protein